MFRTSLGMLTLACLASVASANDFVVTAPGSIQTAIDAAIDGDRVLVQPGTYFESLNFAGKANQVIGVGGSAVTVLDAGGVGSAVSFQNGEGPTTRLAGFGITGASNSGIVTAPGVTPTIEGCEIFANVGTWGGGVHGDAILLRCTIRNNHASTGNGGGVWGTPFMEDCLVLQNTVTSGAGGGVYIQASSAVVRDCRIEGNSAVFGQGRGAGIYVNSPAELAVTGTILTGNFASAGVFGAYGAGLFVEAAGTTVDRCTIVGNTLSGSSELGGGIYGPAVVTNSIVRGNTGSQLASVTTVSYCDVEGGALGTGNIDADPLLVDPVGGDYDLSPGSPCIDAGDPLAPLDANASVLEMGALPFDIPAASTYCLGLANSAGPGASIGWTGNQSVTANDFALSVSGVPSGMPGVFFYGASKVQEPFRDGLLCIDAQGQGLHRLLPAVFSAPDGSASYDLDFTLPPLSAGPGAILPGSTWSFQCWYRDPAAVLSGSNLSNALRAGFAL